MGNFFCVVCELDDFVDDDDRAFQRQHNQRKKQLKDQQEALSYGLICIQYRLTDIKPTKA